MPEWPTSDEIDTRIKKLIESKTDLKAECDKVFVYVEILVSKLKANRVLDDDHRVYKTSSRIFINRVGRSNIVIDVQNKSISKVNGSSYSYRDNGELFKRLWAELV